MVTFLLLRENSQIVAENLVFEAFYCTEVPPDVTDGGEYEGCAVECQENEILIADPRSATSSVTVSSYISLQRWRELQVSDQAGPDAHVVPWSLQHQLWVFWD